VSSSLGGALKGFVRSQRIPEGSSDSTYVR
jgi:hypothetical protein